MNLVIVGSKKQNSEDTLFIRGTEDRDGDFNIEVSLDSEFSDPVGLGFFTASSGKLRFTAYADFVDTEDYEDLVDFDEEGQIIVD